MPFVPESALSGLLRPKYYPARQLDPITDVEGEVIVVSRALHQRGRIPGAQWSPRWGGVVGRRSAAIGKFASLRKRLRATPPGA